MSNVKKLSSLSICGRITLNLHSLNNEGGEGNQVLTRQVTIVDASGNIATVNAVSGDMLKHVQAEHFWQIAIEKNLPLSSAAKTFNANRINASKEFIDYISTDTIKDKDAVKIDKLLELCSLTDVAGVLVTAEKNNLPRKSCAEFGWLIAIPKINSGDTPEFQSFFHAKYVPDAGSIESGEGANLGQNIFHRPANSGVYAVVANFDIYRVGYNDMTKLYPVNDAEREKRVKAFLESILRTFISLKGAMRNTQNPHVVNFEGVIATSNTSMPAPTVSPINEQFVDKITKTKDALNKITKDSIDVLEFKSIDEFTEKMAALISDTKPFKLGVSSATTNQ